MNETQKNFCRNLEILRSRFGLNERQLAGYLKLSVEAVEALRKGEWSSEVDVGTLFLIYGYYGIAPAQMMGDGGI